jgi:hypothetical protein
MAAMKMKRNTSYTGRGGYRLAVPHGSCFRLGNDHYGEDETRNLMKKEFPSRQVIRHSPQLLEAAAATDPSSPSILAFDEAPPSSHLFRLVAGEDSERSAMSVETAEALGDVFSRSILLKGRNPLTLRALDEAIAAIDDPPLPVRHMFLIAEGAQFAAAGRAFEPNARLVFTWQAGSTRAPDILVSTVAAADDAGALLQLIAWSDRDGAFHFFERTHGAWVWAGNSFHALKAPSRGKGPFDSHVNGGLVMKELKAPWPHWHSMAASISRDVFGAAGEFNQDNMFANLDGAEALEPIVRTGVRRWTKRRIAAHMSGGVLADLRDYMRQVLWCTSVNLTSSMDSFASAEPRFDVPTSFFFDIDAIDAAASLLDPDASVIPPARLGVDAALYRAAIAERHVRVVDDSELRRSVDGDTHFAFLVPERAFEDLAVLTELMNREVLSARLALCLLLVDFSNPLFSPERAFLLRYVPETIASGNKGAALDEALIGAAEAAGAGGTAEAELVALWRQADLLGHASGLLKAYQAKVVAKLAEPAGVAEILALAESRRDVVRRTRSLAEFRSTFARSDAPPLHLAMAPDGTIFTKTSIEGEGEL